MNRLIKTFSNIYTFCSNGINKLNFVSKKGVIHMNTWIVGKNLIKPHFQIKKLLTVNYI